MELLNEPNSQLAKMWEVSELKKRVRPMDVPTLRYSMGSAGDFMLPDELDTNDM